MQTAQKTTGQIFIEKSQIANNLAIELKNIQKEIETLEKELKPILEKKGKIKEGKFTLFLSEKVGRGGLSWGKVLEAIPTALKLNKPQKTAFEDLKNANTSLPKVTKIIDFIEAK